MRGATFESRHKAAPTPNQTDARLRACTLCKCEIKAHKRARLWLRASLVLPAVNKRALLNRIIARLQSELDMLTQAALSTHAEATDEENKAEDKYDTRGLEASYLAIGQSKAAEEAAQAVAQFSALTARDFGSTEPVSLGALLLLESNGHSTHYFMGPRAGGTEIEHEGHTVLVITPQSPLGRQLMGRTQGATLYLDLGGKRTQQIVAKVS